MKRISFWYEFDDEVCEAFTRFLAAAGFSTNGLSEYFDN